eukprot:scaffold4442_cov125-Amphora_coffeaeformis.AAC.39
MFKNTYPSDIRSRLTFNPTTYLDQPHPIQTRLMWKISYPDAPTSGSLQDIFFSHIKQEDKAGIRPLATVVEDSSGSTTPSTTTRKQPVSDTIADGGAHGQSQPYTNHLTTTTTTTRLDGILPSKPKHSIIWKTSNRQ